MTKRYDFTVYGKPVGKERPRMARNGRVFTPQKTRDYESKVALECAKVIHEPLTERGVAVTVVAYFRTKSHSDLDNVVKAVMDGMNKVAFVDDRLVDEIHAFIYYVETDAEQRVDVIVSSENE